MTNPDLTPPLTRWLPWDGPDELAEVKLRAQQIASEEAAKAKPALAKLIKRPAKRELTWADYEPDFKP